MKSRKSPHYNKYPYTFVPYGSDIFRFSLISVSTSGCLATGNLTSQIGFPVTVRSVLQEPL